MFKRAGDCAHDAVQHHLSSIFRFDLRFKKASILSFYSVAAQYRLTAKQRADTQSSADFSAILV